MNVISAVFLFLGAILVAGGVVVLVLRRRFADNLSNSGLVRGEGRSPIMYAVGVGLMQIVLGVALTVAAAASGNISGVGDFDKMVSSIAEEGGAYGQVTAILLVVSGAGAMGCGLALGIRTWGRREEWQGGGASQLPKRHSMAIIGGTILLAYGMLALISGCLLVAGVF